MSYRITRVLCPECEGAGKSRYGWPCPVCLGAKKATKGQIVERALFRNSWASACYILGDIGYDDMMKERSVSEKLRALAKEMDDGSMV